MSTRAGRLHLAESLDGPPWPPAAEQRINTVAAVHVVAAHTILGTDNQGNRPGSGVSFEFWMMSGTDALLFSHVAIIRGVIWVSLSLSGTIATTSSLANIVLSFAASSFAVSLISVD
jgi:hypothetical protein